MTNVMATDLNKKNSADKNTHIQSDEHGNKKKCDGVIFVKKRRLLKPNRSTPVLIFIYTEMNKVSLLKKTKLLIQKLMK